MAEEKTGQLVLPDAPRVRRESTEIVAQATNDAQQIMSIITQASRGEVNAETLATLLKMRDDEIARVAKLAFDGAMVEFKKNAPKIVKDKHVFFSGKDGKRDTDYWHATLPNVVAQVIDGLAAVGISHAWKTKTSEGGEINVACILTHDGGHVDVTPFPPVKPDITGNKNPIQAIQSAKTYAQRYSLLDAVGLSAADDDDGRAGGGSNLPTGGDITEAQVADLQALITEHGGDLAKLLKHWKVSSLSEIPQANYKFCVDFVRDMAQRKAQRPPRGAK